MCGAAGKGGIIKTISSPLNPRIVSVHALGTPSDREKTQWYFQRYVKELPAAGEWVIFDRSWYNRAGVEKVRQSCENASSQRPEASLRFAQFLSTLPRSCSCKFGNEKSEKMQTGHHRSQLISPLKLLGTSVAICQVTRQSWRCISAFHFDASNCRSSSEMLLLLVSGELVSISEDCNFEARNESFKVRSVHRGNHGPGQLCLDFATFATPFMDSRFCRKTKPSSLRSLCRSWASATTSSTRSSWTRAHSSSACWSDQVQPHSGSVLSGRLRFLTVVEADRTIFSTGKPEDDKFLKFDTSYHSMRLTIFRRELVDAGILSPGHAVEVGSTY